MCLFVWRSIFSARPMLANRSFPIIAIMHAMGKSKVQGAHVCVCVCFSVCLSVCVCMVQWFVQSISNRNIVGLIPTECSYTRLSSPFLSLDSYNSQMCMSEYECVMGKKVYEKWNCCWPKIATGSCVVQDQAPQQCWSIWSALHPDRWCNYGTSNVRMCI